MHRSVGNRHASKTHILSPDTFPGASQASKTRTLNQKVRQTCVPSARKSAPKPPASVKNAYPRTKRASKTHTLKQKVDPKGTGHRPASGPAENSRDFQLKTMISSIFLAFLQGDTCSQQVRQKRVPLTRKSAPMTPASVKNVYPQAESASKTRTLSQKECQKRVPSARKSVHLLRKEYVTPTRNQQVFKKASMVWKAQEQKTRQNSNAARVFA